MKPPKMLENWKYVASISIYIYIYIVLIIRNPYLETHEFAQKWRMHHSNLTV